MDVIKQQKKRNFTALIWTLTVAINLLIALAFFLPGLETLKKYDFSFLPLTNVVLNSLTFISLIIALIAIKKKDLRRHRAFILLALFWTSLFLVSYLLYHFSTPSTKFGGEGLARYVYFFILLTHIVLAIVIVPLVLVSIGYGLNSDVSKHRRIARWTMPLWLYVSLTGVLVYIMISPYYA